MNETETKLQVRNLERIGAKKFNSYEAAAKHRDSLIESKENPISKRKIFARYDGTYDVVWYKKIGTVQKKDEPEVAPEKPKKVHGQKSKDRKQKK